MPILKVPKRYELTKRSGRFRRNMTRQEKHIWYDYLRKLPFTINRQMIIGSYIVDFYCAKAGIVIEIDGIQHYWKKQYLYDKKRTEKLESYGLQVIRFTNKEIDTKFESICIFMDKIFKEYIKNHSNLSCHSPKPVSSVRVRRPPPYKQGGLPNPYSYRWNSFLNTGSHEIL